MNDDSMNYIDSVQAITKAAIPPNEIIESLSFVNQLSCQNKFQEYASYLLIYLSKYLDQKQPRGLFGL